ncbi:hypothetical protein ACQR16_06025 [Bradyrhizobium oligotrophicum]|uniref:hypothetical protein n=1 Tax=Bradyrhizobium oligotrophicum TaxID=44255 RepID=UPI003EBC5D8B
MATTTVYVEILSRLLGIPVPTITTYIQRLRKDETVFRRGKQGPGAVEPTAAEIANLIIALCATPSTGRKGPDPLNVVRTARAAVRLEESRVDATTECLTVTREPTFGDAIEALIADIRSGAYAAWKGEGWPRAVIRFYDHGGRIFINLCRHGDAMTALVFRNDDGDHGGPCLEQIAELEIFAIEMAAKAMGPVMTAPD